MQIYSKHQIMTFCFLQVLSLPIIIDFVTIKSLANSSFFVMNWVLMSVVHHISVSVSVSGHGSPHGLSQHATHYESYCY